MPDVTDVFKSVTDHLPDLHWTGTLGGDELSAVKAKSGVDVARGPWVKMTYTKAETTGSVQGYWLYAGGERVKVDGHIESAEDDMRMEIRDAGLMVRFSGKHQSGPDNGNAFAYEFLGKF